MLIHSIYLTDQYTRTYTTRLPARLSFNFLLTRTQLGHLRFEYTEQNSDCDFTILLPAHYIFIHCRYAYKVKLFIVVGKELHVRVRMIINTIILIVGVRSYMYNIYCESRFRFFFFLPSTWIALS